MKKLFTIIVVTLLLSCMSINIFALEPIIPTPGDGDGSGKAGTYALEHPPIIDNVYPTYTENYVDSNFNIQFKVQQITADTFHFCVEVTHLDILPYFYRGNDSIGIAVQGLSIISSSCEGSYKIVNANGSTTESLDDISISSNGAFMTASAMFEEPTWPFLTQDDSFSVVFEFNATVTYPSLPLNFTTYAFYSRENTNPNSPVTVENATVYMSELISYVPST